MHQGAFGMAGKNTIGLRTTSILGAKTCDTKHILIGY